MIEICAELDAVEAAAWDRIGGPTAGDRRVVRALERDIGQRPADCLEVAAWRVARLKRATENDWRKGLIAPLAAAVDADAVAWA